MHQVVEMPGVASMASCYSARLIAEITPQCFLFERNHLSLISHVGDTYLTKASGSFVSNGGSFSRLGVLIHIKSLT